MISYTQAIEIIRKQTTLASTEKLSLLSALGKISANDVASSMNVPSFRNSAMDGFAVRATEVATAGVTLKFSQTIAAGDLTKNSNGECVQIMTGAIVPDCYDAVIPVEDVVIIGEMVTFYRPAKPLENIRNIGEDVQIGQVVLQRGKAVSAEKIMLLAALGIAEIEVFATPKFHILSTGKEITDDYSEPLPVGKIYNANAPYLLARCAEEGLSANYDGIFADDADEFEQHIQQIPAGSIIISTGAVSKGEWDFIPESLKKLGATIHFHRVNIRPGKPLLFATLPNGSYFFGLAGNPISTAIGFQFFVLPFLQFLQGKEPQQPLIAKLTNDFTKKGDFRQFLKANLTNNANGELLVDISGGQESFKISPMAQSNAWVVLSEEQTQLKAGDLVTVFPFGGSL
jgi:molybdopterin molybdotransferase